MLLPCMTDMTIESLVMLEEMYRGSTLNLLASENRVPSSARKLLAGDLSGRYTLPLNTVVHGEMVRNGYGGTKYADAIVEAVERLLCRIFGAKWCDVRPLSGHIAAMSALRVGVVKGAKSLMAVPADSGGYDGYESPYMPALMGIRSYHIPMAGPQIDLESFKEEYEKKRPDMVVLGQSYFTEPYDLKAVSEIINGRSLLLYDASHVLGLLAGGRFQPDALEYCDLVYGSTHKTFPGPQGGVIMGKDMDLADAQDKDYIWTVIDNPHIHRIASVGRVLEILYERGQKYADAIIGTATRLARELASNGIPLLYGPEYTQSHQILIDLAEVKKKYNLGGQELCDRLEDNSIIIDSVGRIGTAEIAQTLPEDNEISEIAVLISRALEGNNVSSEVQDLNIQMSSRGSILEGAQ